MQRELFQGHPWLDNTVQDTLKRHDVIERRLPCPPDFIAALGSIIGARCAIKPKAYDPWFIVPNLWGGIVGDPSAKKSRALVDSFEAVELVDRQGGGAAPSGHARRRPERRVFRPARGRRTDKVFAKKPSKGDPLSVARELQELRDAAPQAPSLRRYKTNDATVEKLGELLRKILQDCLFCGTNWLG